MHPASSVDLAAVRDAVALAEVWLDGATTFPVGATHGRPPGHPAEWVDKTMPTWQRLVAPVADRMGAATVESLPEEVRSQAGPMIGMLTSMGGMAFGSQLGAALAQLGKEVLTSTDIGLPLGPDRTAALLPTRDRRAEQQPGDRRRPGPAVPGRSRGRAPPAVPRRAVAEGQDRRAGRRVRGAHHDRHVGGRRADDVVRSDEPCGAAGVARRRACWRRSRRRPSSGSPAGSRPCSHWSRAGSTPWWPAAVGERLPAARRRWPRCCAAGGRPAGLPRRRSPTLIGVELRPRQLRAAAQLWRDLAETRGVDGRDAMWSDYDLLPTADDLESPDDFVARDKQFSELLAGLDDLTVADFEDKPTELDDPTTTGEAAAVPTRRPGRRIEGRDGPALRPSWTAARD